MINMEYDQKLCGWIDAHRDRILADWMDLIRIPSVQGEAEPKAPYGKECARALKTAAHQAQMRGFPVRVEEEAGYALASYGTGEKVIGLFGHCDVVPAGDGWLFTEPFVPVIKDGMLIGRGCGDNKAGVIASICVLEALRDCQIPIRSTVQAFMGSNEESGMGDIEAFAAKEKMPDLSFVPDMSFPCSVGEKGILRMWAECKTPLKTIRDFRGGDAFNIVLDHVEVALPFDPELEEQLRVQIGGNEAYRLERVRDGLRLEASGIAKHASTPKGSINATVLAAQVLARCGAVDSSDREILRTVCALLENYYGEGLGIAQEDPDFTPLTAANGMVVVENGRLRVSLDIRYGTGMEPDRLEQLLHRAWEGAGWSIAGLINDPGFLADKDSPVPGIMMELCRELAGEERKPFLANGGTYARHLNNAFGVGLTAAIPGYTGTLPEIPAGRGGAHQRDECISVDHFFQGLRILLHAVIRCDRQLNEH